MKHKIKLTFISTFFILASLIPQLSLAQDDRYIGEIVRGGWNFCPRGTLAASGQLLPIAQNTALFSLYGTNFGGDGETTFALPDLRGRAAINNGNGPGLSNYTIGTQIGQETVTLDQTQMPAHTHSATVHAAEHDANSSSPSEAAFSESEIYNTEGVPATNVALHSGTIEIASIGANQSHENRMPFLTVTYCVVLYGLFPSQN